MKVLITGANAGLGKECALQLASVDGVDKIYLGCRNLKKAEAAKADLEVVTGKLSLYEIIMIDVSDLESVRKAVEKLPNKIDGVVLNAGGAGVDPMGKSKYDGVCNITALNLLGHALLVDLLLSQKKLTTGGTVVYSGSEAARGIPSLGTPKPEIDFESEQDYRAICDGSIVKGDADGLYAFIKMMAALWIGSMARKEPTIRFVTMSPGACAGTEIMNPHPFLKRTLLRFMMKLFQWLGKGHDVPTGATRYIDALLDKDSCKSGVFYASKEGLTGPVSDQAETWDIFHNEEYQDTANKVIHSLIK